MRRSVCPLFVLKNDDELDKSCTSGRSYDGGKD